MHRAAVEPVSSVQPDALSQISWSLFLFLSCELIETDRGGRVLGAGLSCTPLSTASSWLVQSLQDYRWPGREFQLRIFGGSCKKNYNNCMVKLCDLPCPHRLTAPELMIRFILRALQFRITKKLCREKRINLIFVT